MSGAPPSAPHGAATITVDRQASAGPSRSSGSSGACPGCGAGPGLEVLVLEGMPARSCSLYRTAGQARECPRGTLRLLACPGCGLWYNAAFEPELVAYDEAYEATQAFSPTFRAYLGRLAGELIEALELRGKQVIEIGCGQGEFLAELVRRGVAGAVGFDPAFDPARHPAPDCAGLVLLGREFGAADTAIPCDAVVCRMTLEHLADVGGFLAHLRSLLSGNSAKTLYLQVPNFEPILNDPRPCDLIYEHCNYFTASTLSALLAHHGFRPLWQSVSYAGQHLGVAARPEPGAPACVEPDLHSSAPQPQAFVSALEAWQSRWKAYLNALRRDGRRAVLWGSGSKATSFLALTHLGEEVMSVVDINPYRQGSYVAGSGHPVIAPQALAEGSASPGAPDAVIVMNPVYRREVAAELERLGLAAEVVAL